MEGVLLGINPQHIKPLLTLNIIPARDGFDSRIMLISRNPFTSERDQFYISSSLTRNISYEFYYQFSLPHFYISLKLNSRC